MNVINALVFYLSGVPVACVFFLVALRASANFRNDWHRAPTNAKLFMSIMIFSLCLFWPAIPYVIYLCNRMTD